MARIKSLLFLLALAQVPLASATVTYVVGSCKPSLPSFIHIMDAVGYSPAPNVVEICPGTYNEQVVISKPMTLEGISAGSSEQATIAAPAGGLVTNASNDLGQSMAVQVLVKSSGEVNLSNLTVDGSGNNVSNILIVVAGIAYVNSPGTANHLTIQNQSGNGNGVGVWLRGGSNQPSVTVENSNLQGFDNDGIVGETYSSTPELTAILKKNTLTGGSNANGIDLIVGLAATINGNLITGGTEGVLINGGEGTVSENKVGGQATGIDLEVDSVSVTSNTIYGSTTGILVFSPVAAVTGNTIVFGATAIDFGCTAGNNVHSNTITSNLTGIANVPATAVTANTYYNVATIRSGGC